MYPVQGDRREEFLNQACENTFFGHREPNKPPYPSHHETNYSSACHRKTTYSLPTITRLPIHLPVIESLIIPLSAIARTRRARDNLKVYFLCHRERLKGAWGSHYFSPPGKEGSKGKVMILLLPHPTLSLLRRRCVYGSTSLHGRRNIYDELSSCLGEGLTKSGGLSSSP